MTTTNHTALHFRLAAMLVALALTGCAPHAASTGANQPASSGAHAQGFLVVGGVDVSGSFRKYLGASAQGLVRVGNHFTPESDSLLLYRVARRADPFFDRPIPTDTATVQYALLHACRTRPDKAGTFPAAFWQAAAQRAQQTNKQVVILFYTDGDNDNFCAEEVQAMRHAAKQLAASPQVVAVAFYGIAPEQQTWVRDCFGALGDRLLFSGPTDMSLDPLFARTDAAQSAAR